MIESKNEAKKYISALVTAEVNDQWCGNSIGYIFGRCEGNSVPVAEPEKQTPSGVSTEGAEGHLEVDSHIV